MTTTTTTTIANFIQDHAIEKSANTTYREGFPIAIPVESDATSMTEMEYEVLKHRMRTRYEMVAVASAVPSAPMHDHDQMKTEQKENEETPQTSAADTSSATTITKKSSMTRTRKQQKSKSHTKTRKHSLNSPAASQKRSSSHK
jgi:hypothetical protein